MDPAAGAGRARGAARRPLSRTLSRVVTSVLCLGAAATAFAQARQIDTEHSRITVRVFKSGLFAMFGDNHVIRAPLSEGTVDESATPSVALLVDPYQLQVLDPGLSLKDRAEVQQRMLGPEVLDAARFTEIRFRSTSVNPIGSGHWMVEGDLTLHGQTRAVKVDVVGETGRYRGSAALKQRDFGIKPISIVGGTVKVKDEVKIEFEIVTVSPQTPVISRQSEWTLVDRSHRSSVAINAPLSSSGFASTAFD